jgi:hypothetical protein
MPACSSSEPVDWVREPMFRRNARPLGGVRNFWLSADRLARQPVDESFPTGNSSTGTWERARTSRITAA